MKEKRENERESNEHRHCQRENVLREILVMRDSEKLQREFNV